MHKFWITESLSTVCYMVSSWSCHQSAYHIIDHEWTTPCQLYMVSLMILSCCLLCWTWIPPAHFLEGESLWVLQLTFLPACLFCGGLWLSKFHGGLRRRLWALVDFCGLVRLLCVARQWRETQNFRRVGKNDGLVWSRLWNKVHVDLRRCRRPCQCTCPIVYHVSFRRYRPLKLGMTNYPIGPHRNQIGPHRT